MRVTDALFAVEVYGSGFWVGSFQMRVQGSGFGVLGLRIESLESRV